MAKRLRDGDGDRWNNVDNGRTDHVSTRGFRSFIKGFRALYDEFRIEKGYTAHLVNMCCPVALFWYDRYSASVKSCHGLGFPTHQKLNEHITRQHSPELAKTGERVAPLLDKSRYDAWKKSTTRKGSAMDKEDIREKWWTTAEALGLTTTRELPENAHMASATNQIPLIDLFVAWVSRRDQPATTVDASTQTDITEPAPYRDPTTTAQRLNERPLADDVLFQQPAHDSGYGTMEPHEDLDDDEPQSRTQFAEDKEEYLLGVTRFSEINDFDVATEGESFHATLEGEEDLVLFENVNWD